MNHQPAIAPNPYIILSENSSTIFTTRGCIPLHVFPATCRKYCNIKMIVYQVNDNCSRIPPYFPATCLKYSNSIGGIPLKLYRTSF